MVKLFARTGIVASLAVLLCSTVAFAQQGPALAANPPGAVPGAGQFSGQGMEALKHAADAQKYLFLFFYQADDDQTRTLRGVFDATMAKVTDRAESLIVNLADASQKPLVSKFGADRAPMPLVLALAPNGAITGGYPLKFDEQLLMGAFCSRSTWESLKALQDGKLVLLCVQNPLIKAGPEALKAAEDVKADPKYAKTTEVVSVDPRDAKEAEALKRLSIAPDTNEAVTILLAPPATIVNRLKGATSKDAIIAEIVKAAAGCGGRCAPGACGPKPPAGAQPAATPGKPQPAAAAGAPSPASAQGVPKPAQNAAKPQPGNTTGKP
jgi:hypothetical protein